MVLPLLIAVLTGRQREKVPTRWTTIFWVSNLFSLWEQIAWRRHGLRVETTAYYQNGKHIVFAHSWESALCLMEQKIRDVFKWRMTPFRIYFPMLITPQGFQIPASPYLFAIGVDSTNSNAGVASPTTSGSFSFTNTAGTIIYVGVQNYSGVAMSTIAYNSVGCTLVREDLTTWEVSIWRLLSPATGSNSVAWTAGSNIAPVFSVITFTGNDTSSPDGNNNSVISTNTQSLTTAFANSAIIGVASVNGAPVIVPGSGYTQYAHVQNAADTDQMYSQYQIVTTATSYTVDFTGIGTQRFTAAEVKVSGGTVTTPRFPFFSLLGVGS